MINTSAKYKITWVLFTKLNEFLDELEERMENVEDEKIFAKIQKDVTLVHKKNNEL